MTGFNGQGIGTSRLEDSRMTKKRCPFCRRWFLPYAPQAARQQICGAAPCKRRLKRTLDRAWRARDPEWRQARQARVRAWAALRHYWPKYRSSHPAYVARDNSRRTRSLRRQRLFRKTGTMNPSVVDKNAGLFRKTGLYGQGRRDPL